MKNSTFYIKKWKKTCISLKCLKIIKKQFEELPQINNLTGRNFKDQRLLVIEFDEVSVPIGLHTSGMQLKSKGTVLEPSKS